VLLPIRVSPPLTVSTLPVADQACHAAYRLRGVDQGQRAVVSMPAFTSAALTSAALVTPVIWMRTVPVLVSQIGHGEPGQEAPVPLISSIKPGLMAVRDRRLPPATPRNRTVPSCVAGR
jgi:hypothetical protein